MLERTDWFEAIERTGIFKASLQSLLYGILVSN